MNNKIYGFLGLAMKAGKIAFGADMCIEKIKNNEVSMLILAEDLSDNTKDKFKNLAETYHTRFVVFGTIEEISQSIGKVNKGIVAVLDDGFGEKIWQMVNIFKGANN